MKKLLFLILAFASPLMAQNNVRFDLPVYTVQASGGNLLPVYAIPGAIVSFYNEPSGSLASTYNSATSATACPTFAQVVLQNTAACVSNADPYGNMGSWFQPGQYMATITAQGRSYNYYFTIGGSGGGGSGTVTDFTAGNLSPLFTTSVANPTTTPALSFTQSTAASLAFYGNCTGSTADPVFCTLVAGANITLTPSGGNTLTIAASGSGGTCSVSNCVINDPTTADNPNIIVAPASETLTPLTILQTNGNPAPTFLVESFGGGTNFGVDPNNNQLTTNLPEFLFTNSTSSPDIIEANTNGSGPDLFLEAFGGEDIDVDSFAQAALVGSIAAGDVVCKDPAGNFGAVEKCAAGTTLGAFAIAINMTGSFQWAGTATTITTGVGINLDATVTVANADIIEMSPTTSGLGHDVGPTGPCTTQQIGIASVNGTSGPTNTIAVKLQFAPCASGVTSINSVAGAFTFSFSSGAGSCSGNTCTFTGSGSGGGSVTNFLTGTWPSWLTPSVATSTTTPTLSVSASAIPNSALANSSITLGSTSVSLGGTISSAAGFNAATATNLASYPTLCTGNQFSQGLSSGSNNCATPADPISGLTANFIPLAGSASTITTNSPLDYGVTTSGVVTSTKPFKVASGGVSTVQIGTTVFSGLGTCNGGAEGTHASVTDSTVNTWGAIVAGGGSDHISAYCDGTNWTVEAQ